MQFRRRRPYAGGIPALGALAAVLAAGAMLITALTALIIVVAGLIVAVLALRRAVTGFERGLAPKDRSDQVSHPAAGDPSRRTCAHNATLVRR